jgi:hypothetical protein
MFKPSAVKALQDYRLWIRYENGTEGEVDLSHLAGRGVFKEWDDYSKFQSVSLGTGSAIVWNDEIDLCGDALYLEITGKKPEEVFLNLQTKEIYA